MVDYAIGDIQGCYEPLMRLLDHLDFNEKADRLWLVGDLVNRGPESLAVLRFLHQLPLAPMITLGNHDLHLLQRIFVPDLAYPGQHKAEEWLNDVLAAEDVLELGNWLRQQSILVHDPVLNVVMTHAGIPPVWNLAQAKQCALELENTLKGPNFRDYLTMMYGNQPKQWSNELQGMDRSRLITNYFTRMRFFDADGGLDLSYDATIAGAPAHLTPWFLVPNRSPIAPDIVFGHWAALQGHCPVPGLYALDTGCVWGDCLTALRLQDRQRFSVPG